MKFVCKYLNGHGGITAAFEYTNKTLLIHTISNISNECKNKYNLCLFLW